MVRTPPFHGGNRGSNPLRDAISLIRDAIRKKLTSDEVSFFVLWDVFTKELGFCSAMPLLKLYGVL